MDVAHTAAETGDYYGNFSLQVHLPSDRGGVRVAPGPAGRARASEPAQTWGLDATARADGGGNRDAGRRGGGGRRLMGGVSRLAKLRAMPPREVLSRTAEKAYLLWERQLHRRGLLARPDRLRGALVGELRHAANWQQALIYRKP